MAKKGSSGLILLAGAAVIGAGLYFALNKGKAVVAALVENTGESTYAYEVQIGITTPDGTPVSKAVHQVLTIAPGKTATAKTSFPVTLKGTYHADVAVIDQQGNILAEQAATHTF